MLPKSPKLRSGVGAFASVLSKLVYPNKPIREKYPNQQKNHKLKGSVLVEVDAKVVHLVTNTIIVLSSPILIFRTNNSKPPSDKFM